MKYILLMAWLVGLMTVRVTAADTPAFATAVPTDWIERPSDKEKTKWWITTAALHGGYPVGTIMVDAGIAVDGNVEESALSWMKDYGGIISNRGALLGGVRGILITNAGKKDEYGPKMCLVLIKDGNTFFITGGGEPEFDVTAAFLYVLKKWKWK